MAKEPEEHSRERHVDRRDPAHRPRDEHEQDFDRHRCGRNQPDDEGGENADHGERASFRRDAHVSRQSKAAAS